MSRKDENMKKLLIGVAIGGAVGATIAVLLNTRARHRLAEFISEATNHFADGHEHRKGFFNGRGYLLGGAGEALLAGISAIFLSPSAERFLRENISEKYQTLGKHTQQLINNLNEKGEKITRMLGKQTSEFADQSLDITDNISEEVRNWAENVRAAAEEALERAEMMEQNPNYLGKLKEIQDWSDRAIDLADTVSVEVERWLLAIQNIAKKMRQQRFDEVEEEGMAHHSVSDLIQWVTAGISIWQNMQGKRRR